jgi:phosphoribosylaminoimidazole-succinocarboxamide synthase
MEKQARIQTILADKGAILHYKGKSKDIYKLPDGNVLMVFGDAFTGGADGKEDPGGNTNVGTKEGLGNKNLAVSTYLYQQISASLGIQTHHIHADLENNILQALRVEVLGKGLIVGGFESGGLEFIARNRAYGSYLRRNAGVEQGANLIGADGLPFVEVSIKNDKGNDPIFPRHAYIDAGLSAVYYDAAVKYTALITQFLTKLFAGAGMELLDIKMEFGVHLKTEHVLLADEISPGSLRAAVDGELISKEEIYERLMKMKGEGI